MSQRLPRVTDLTANAGPGPKVQSMQGTSVYIEYNMMYLVRRLSVYTVLHVSQWLPRVTDLTANAGPGPKVRSMQGTSVYIEYNMMYLVRRLSVYTVLHVSQRLPRVTDLTANAGPGPKVRSMQGTSVYIEYNMMYLVRRLSVYTVLPRVAAVAQSDGPYSNVSADECTLSSALKLRQADFRWRLCLPCRRTRLLWRFNKI